VRGTFEAEGLPRVDVTIALPPGQAGAADRYMYAAFTTLKILGTWLVPFPDPKLSVAVERTRWWTAPPSMAPESAVARAVSRAYWSRVIDSRALGVLADGLVEYSTRRAVSKIVDERYLAVYLGRAEGRYFGGFVPRDLRVQLPADSGGSPGFRTLVTLERWVGRPVFDAILVEFLRSSSASPPTIDEFTAVASRVSGQDLTWFFDATLRQPGVFDYAVENLESAPQADGRFHTTVTVRRVGDAVFGRGLALVTTFADGETVRDTVDGRRAGQTFEYRSPSRAVSAEVDPDRVLLLDVNHGNNGVTLDTGPGRTAATRWTARWMIWLEDALLTYVAFT